MSVYDHRKVLTLLKRRQCFSSSEIGLKNSGLHGDFNLDLYISGAVLHQLSYRAN